MLACYDPGAVCRVPAAPCPSGREVPPVRAPGTSHTLSRVSEFDDALALSALGEGTSTGRLDHGWWIGGGINGGLLMALAARALGDRLAERGAAPAHRDVVALSTYFLSASVEGPVEAVVETVRLGRTLSTGEVSLFQDGPAGPVERLRALGSLGDLGAMGESLLRSPAPPQLPPPAECLTSAEVPSGLRDAVPLMHRIDLRLDPRTAGWAVGAPTREGRMRGWVRFADGRPVDALSLLFFLDALPPVSFDLGILGWAPTLELTAHVRARPADGWLLAEVSTETVTATVMEEDARIWDSTGRLVAQSRQLAGIRTSPRAGSRPGSADPAAAARVSVDPVSVDPVSGPPAESPTAEPPA